MPPKFQSSFIPRGPLATNVPVTSMPTTTRRKPRDLISFLCGSFFTLSIILALATFGYKYFLNYRIAGMGRQLEETRSTLGSEAVNELIALDNRLVSAKTLLKNHRIISPLFEFLSTSTPKTVRYNSFTFDLTPKGVEVRLIGEARSYGALAAAADVIYQANTIFLDPIFSDLKLDAKGNVSFILTSTLSSELISYQKFIDKMTTEILAPVSTSTGTTSAPGSSN